MISGAKSGEVVVWRNWSFDASLEPNSALNNVNLPWVAIKTLHDHERQISSIFIDESMSLFVTSSLDGSVNLYNLWSSKFQRSFKHPNLAPVN